MFDEKLRLQALEKLAALDEELGFAAAPDWTWPKDKPIAGWTLVCTSAACPEQYDVFTADGRQVGYLRLRGGRFRANYPEHGGETVYAAAAEGDGLFEESEREPQLQAAIAALQARHAEYGHES